MKFKIKILLVTIIITVILAAGCQKKLKIQETLNPIEIEEETTNKELDDEENEEKVEDKDNNYSHIIYMDKAIVENNQVLVPAKIISEELGANFSWNSEQKTILIEKEGRSILFKIESRLINYNNGLDYELSKVSSRLFNKDEDDNQIAYVPLNGISNGLNIGTLWNEEEKNIYINYDKETEKKPIQMFK